MKNQLDYDPDAIGGKDTQDDWFGEDPNVNEDGEDKKELQFEEVSDDLADDKDEDEEHDYGEENL